MGKAGGAFLGLIAGYVIGAALSATGIELLSSNTHGRSVEMAMTGAFVTGPIGAVLGLSLALLWRRKSEN